MTQTGLKQYLSAWIPTYQTLIDEKIWASKRGYIYQLLFEFYFRASVLENTNPVVYYEGFTAHLKCKLCCYKHLLDV